MNRLLTLLLLCVTLAVSVRAEKKPAPSIVVEEKAHDFGTIRQADGNVTHVFTFSNDGEAPLLILSAKASCGCTKPEYSKKPILPGEKSSVKVTYRPDNPGEFDKMVTLTTNDPKHRKVALRIQGTVVPKN